MGKTICEYYSNVTAKPVDWLWYPYIPYGKLTVIQGDPGEGKSTFVLNLVSLLTNGQKMPMDIVCPDRALLFISARKMEWLIQSSPG